MATQTQICNMALASLGQRMIAEIGNVSDQNARVCNLFYVDARRATLRANEWKFALKVQTLALFLPPIPALPQGIPGWNYVYAYPGNALSILKVYSDSNDAGSNNLDDYTSRYGFNSGYNDYDAKHGLSEPHRIMQNPNDNTDGLVIVSDASPAWCEYIIDEQNTDLYDSNFVEAFSYRLAAMMAQSLTGDPSIAKAMMDAYQLAIDRASRINAQQGFQKPHFSSSILNSR